MLNKHKIYPILSLVIFTILTSPTSAAPLNKQQLSNQIIGKTLLTKKMGMSVQVSYKNNGTVTVNMPITSAKGTWRFKGNQICMNMKSGPRQGLTCITFEHIQGNKYRNSQGMNFTLQE